MELANKFEEFFIDHMPRHENTYADALASLAVTLALPARSPKHITIGSHKLLCPQSNIRSKKLTPGWDKFWARDWPFPLIDYVPYDILSEDSKEAGSIRNKATKIYYNAILQMLYHKYHDDILFHCLSKGEAQEVVKEIHDGTCGAHQPRP